MSLQRRYKWMELRHGKIIEPDPIHDLEGDGDTQFLNRIYKVDSFQYGYDSRGEAIMDLQRIDEMYPNRKEEYMLMEFWTKGVKE